MRQKLFFLVAAKEDVKAREKEKNPPKVETKVSKRASKGHKKRKKKT